MRTERDVHAYLSATASTAGVAGLAYAAFAFDKFAWIDHRTAGGGAPTDAEVEAWVADLPDSRLDGLVTQATDLFDQAARAYLAGEHALDLGRAARKAVTREVKRSNRRVLRRVEQATSFWRGLPGELVVGLISATLFVAIVAGASWVFTNDPSPFALLKSMLSGPRVVSPST